MSADAKVVPNLVFAIESYERYLIMVSVTGAVECAIKLKTCDSRREQDGSGRQERRDRSIRPDPRQWRHETGKSTAQGEKERDEEGKGKKECGRRKEEKEREASATTERHGQRHEQR